MPVRFHPNNPIDSLETIIVKEDGTPLRGEINVNRKLWEDLDRSGLEWDVWHDLKLSEHSDHFNYYKKTNAQVNFENLFPNIVTHIHGSLQSVKNILTPIRETDSSLKGNGCMILIE